MCYHIRGRANLLAEHDEEDADFAETQTASPCGARYDASTG